MGNYYFVRRVTSSIVVSLFALSFGVGTFKSVDAQNTKVLDFCQQNPSLFNLKSEAKRKLRIAVFDIEDENSISFSGQIYEFKGYSKILASQLVKNNNFDVVSWNQIKPTKINNPNFNKSVRLTQDKISIELLRDIRDKYGIEAVFIGTVNQFEVSRERGIEFLGFGKTTRDNEVDVKLNFRVVDTTTGDIIFVAEGNSNFSKSFSDVKVPNISVEIQKSTNDDSIIFKLESGIQTEFFYSSSDNITNKLLALAMEDAIDKIVDKLNNYSDDLACFLRIPTVVADVEGNTVILNKGKLHGYCEGMKFSIERSPQPVIDPVTGQVIRIKMEKVGEITLSEVDAQSSIGDGSTVLGKFFRVKDIAKLIDANCSKSKTKVI